MLKVVSFLLYKVIPLADLQEVHIDADYYDTHFKPGAYLRSHAEHMKKWHSED